MSLFRRLLAYCADHVCYKFLFVIIASFIDRRVAAIFPAEFHTKWQRCARVRVRAGKNQRHFCSTHLNRKRDFFSFIMRCCYQICVTLGNKLVLSFCFDFFSLFHQGLELSPCYFADSCISISCIKTWQAGWAESHLVDWNAGMPYIFQCNFWVALGGMVTNTMAHS